MPDPVTPDLQGRLNALLIECGRQETAIYRGTGVPPVEALAFIGKVQRLVDAACGFADLETHEDVMEALEDAC